MKKLFPCLVALVFALSTRIETKALNSKSLKKVNPQENTLLKSMKALIAEKRLKKIAQFRNHKNKWKQESARVLNNRIYLDHIKLIGNNKTIYLQLKDSYQAFGFYLGSYPFNATELEQKLDALSQANVQCNKDAKIKIYPSTKFKKHRFFKSFYTYNNLYSASIKINQDI